MKTKAVAYAYPSSPTADRFGFSKTGCYVLKTINGINPPIVASVHPTLTEAKEAGKALSELPWSKYSM